MAPSCSVTLGLLQMSMEADPATNLESACANVVRAAGQGAQVVVLPELFRTHYFCLTQDTQHFDLAETVPGPTTEVLCPLAKKLGVVIVAPVFEKAAPGLYFNTAAIIDADGTYLGKYRKMHIPQDPGFEEKFYFTPGDLGFPVFQTQFAKLGVLICWDQWYPEAARLMALGGAEILIYPTAIGWLPEEKAELGAAQHTAWQTVQRGHAVANGCYVATVNRCGKEGDTEFWGQSFISDFYGQVVAEADASESEIITYTCDLQALEDFRQIWPFFRDRRIDAFADLQKRIR